VVVGWNLPLLNTDRVVPHDAAAIDDEHGRALAEAHHLAGNVVGIEDAVIGVCEKREGVTVVAYESRHAIKRVRRDRENGRTRLMETIDVCSQLREVSTTERSAEASEKHQHDRTGTQRVGEVHLRPVLIHEGEVGRRRPDRRGSAVHGHGSVPRAENTARAMIRGCAAHGSVLLMVSAA
jgi:hypothetical protein